MFGGSLGWSVAWTGGRNWDWLTLTSLHNASGRCANETKTSTAAPLAIATYACMQTEPGVNRTGLDDQPQ